jgi:isoleucyl-tRNA synthetase
MPYRPVPPRVELPELEHEVIEFWRDNDTFAASLARNDGNEPWTFYEGPPTANGQPGIHHVEARVFKDVFPRFQTMRGRYVERRAGWDCHGLPVELAVERELGINGKPQIEEYGIAAFNERCRESVLRNVDAFTELTTRMGYWVDLDRAYLTMSSDYVESVWWGLQQIFNNGLLVEDYRVAPYCPRCGTTLSDHELAQGYEFVFGPSLFVRLPLTSGPLAGRASLLIWTTTPWTLPANTAVAVNPSVTYVAVSDGAETLVIAEPLVEQVVKGDGSEDSVWTVVERFSGQSMQGWTYQRPFDWVEFPPAQERPGTGTASHYVVLSDHVTYEDGTGLVHQAPSFGAEDMAVGRDYGLPMVNPVRADGTFEESVPLVGGHFFQNADPTLIDDLDRRGLVFRSLTIEHAYPHCWRCHTPLLYYARPSWYIRTTDFKDALLRENKSTNWYPSTVKFGRFGDWLENNVDWALSRDRYWGTPLPIWRNDRRPDRLVCVGSLAELSRLAGRDLCGLDPHRPFIDDVTFTLPDEAGTYRRVPEVIDAWFDSGSMPFAQWGFPHAEGSATRFADAYPADFICEAIDQTRGWFYTLLAIGTAVFDRTSYRNVLCLGHILAEDGRKMSKNLGNILLPIPLMEQYGADAVRWFMAAAGSPWAARRIGHTTLQEIVRKVLLTYWNVVAFQSLYARTNGWSPDGSQPVTAERHVMDQWLVSATENVTHEVTEALEAFDAQRAGIVIADFLNDLSNWYVRRSRRRFWAGDPAALWTLHRTLHVLTRLMAPLTPFLTERVWRDLFVATDLSAAPSVHLSSWPVADQAVVDHRLNEGMHLARRLVELGRAARAEAKLKIRQPLRRALVSSSLLAALGPALTAEVCAELNIGELTSFSAAGDIVEHLAKANYRALGRRFGKRTPAVAAAIAAADAAELNRSLRERGVAELSVDGDTVEVTEHDVVLSERPRAGWSVLNRQGETIALDLEITPELTRAGIARDVVRFVQEMRKQSGFEVSDRIHLVWSSTDADVAEAIDAFGDVIADEVLATTFESGHPGPDAVTDEDLGLRVTLRLA